MADEELTPMMALMQRFGAPLTRENYLEWAHLGKPPKITPELEENLPERFQLPVREYDRLDVHSLPEDKEPGKESKK